MENSIFSPSYWKSAWGEVKNLRRLMFAALMCALSIVIGGFYVAVGESLRIYFTFFITAVGCAVYGPVLGLLSAVVTDTLNYILFPTGAYFPGYLLSEILNYLICSLMLYRKKITVWRLFGTKFLMNYGVNVLLGCLWNQILFGKGYLYYLAKSLIKNTLLLPLEVIALAALFAVLLPGFSRMGLLPAHGDKELRRLELRASVFPVMGLWCLLGAGCSFYYYSAQGSGAAFLVIAVVMAVLGLALLVWGAVRVRRSR